MYQVRGKVTKTPSAPLMIIKILDVSFHRISLKINNMANVIIVRSYQSDIHCQPLLDTCHKKLTSLFLQPTTSISTGS